MKSVVQNILKSAKNIHSTQGSGGFGQDFIGSGFGGAKWSEGLSGDGVTPTYNNARLRANGRGAYQDSTLAETVAKRSADLIADVGLKFFSSPDWRSLGITQLRAKEIGDSITRSYHSYSLSKKQERSGNMNMYQAQRLYQLCNQRDGEEFIRFYYSKDKSLLSPLQFSFIDPNQIRGDVITDTFLPAVGYDGINRNTKGEEVSYDIWTIKKNGEIIAETIPRIGERSKRIFMVHCFAPEFPGQKRGLSKLGTSAQDFQNVEDFIQAHTQKAINESNIFMYAENQQFDPSNPTRDQNVPAGAGLRFAKNPGTTPSAEAVNPELICQRPVVPTLKPGSMAFFNLTQGDKLKPFPNTAPSDGFDKFLDSYSSFISAKHGIPKSIMKMEFGQSYSASRGELLMYWKTVNIERGEMVSDFNNPHLEMYISEEIAAGRLMLPGWGDPRLKSAWMGGIWYGSSIPSIDPEKEAKANKLNLMLNATTLDRVSRNLDGSTAEANIADNKKIYPEMEIPYWEEKNTSQIR